MSSAKAGEPPGKLGLLLAIFIAGCLVQCTFAQDIDATSLQQRVLCGYQGWFRCPGDGTSDGWLHWSRNSRRLTSDSVTFEMWPDLSEYSAGERFATPGFTDSQGNAMSLFSSANVQTVERHFQWMKEYGIDGAFVQRFLVELRRSSFDTVLNHVREAAAKTGRVYAVCYDMSGAAPDRQFDLLVNDWKRLVDELKVTQDKSYLHHAGKPVLFVWGFFPERFDAELAHRLIDFLKGKEHYRVTLIGGCLWQWRTVKDPEWARAFRRLDVISPWNVGNHRVVEGQKVAATEYWQADLLEAQKNGVEYLPVIYPGFGWTNLKGTAAARQTIPRRKGEFFWRQFVDAANLDIQTAYIAMFDEVDEGTAIFKVTNSPPTEVPFQTLEGLPTDWYLRLAGEGTKLLRSGRQGDLPLPIQE